MDNIEKLIKERGKNFNYCFVFPNSLSQRLCLNKTLELTGLSTIPSELYISWHIFIKEHFVENANIVTNPIRCLYAEYITNKNEKATQEGHPVFKALIPFDKAHSSNIFANWISSILPELHYFLENKSYDDEELEDLRFLAHDYFYFLKEHNLIEAMWERNNFYSDGKKYIIIYPELIDDFYNYEKVLKNNADVEFLHISFNNKKEPYLLEFEDARLEIKYIVSKIEELILKGVAVSDIALSIVDIESLKAYVKSEFEIRGLPIDIYVRLPLIQSPFSYLFNDIKEIIEKHYSFEVIKKFFLNKSILWNKQDDINKLINFGIEHNCAYSWKEENKWHNVWDEAFKSLSTYKKEDNELFKFFLEIKRNIEKIYYCTSFSEMEKSIKYFLKFYIDKKTFEIEINNRIQKYCFNLIKELKKVENQFESYFKNAKINRYNFFLKLLKKLEISPEVDGNGVSIFPFGVPVAVPFKYHFVINMNQRDGNIIYGNLKFLREDKRNEIKAKDIDLTSYYICALSNLEHITFSYSKKLYNGYAISHSAFKNKMVIETKHIEDSFYNENCYFLEKENSFHNIYENQLNHIKKAEHFDVYPSFSFISSAYPKSFTKLQNKIKEFQYSEGKFIVSATNLNDFFCKCPTLFFLSNILKIREKNLNAFMFNPRIIGNIYHAILEKIYKNIMHKEGVFNKDCLKSENEFSYLKILENSFNEVIKINKRNYGPLSELFIKAMELQIKTAIENVLNFDSLHLDKYTQYIIEGKYKNDVEGDSLIKLEENGILYIGKMDRVVKDSEGLVILDYKTNEAPENYKIENEMIKDFQMPFYVFLLEQNEKSKSLTHNENSSKDKKVKAAYFLKLLPKDYSRIIKSDDIKSDGKLSGKTREDFEEAIEVMKKCVIEFKERIELSNFIPDGKTQEGCNVCIFKHICRTSFIVRGR